MRAGLRRALVQIVCEFLACIIFIELRTEPFLDERHDYFLAAHTAHEIRTRCLPDRLWQCFIVLMKVLEKCAAFEHQLRITVRWPTLKSLCSLRFADCFHGRQNVEVLCIVAQPLGVLRDHTGHRSAALAVQCARDAQHTAEIGDAVHMPSMFRCTCTHSTLEAP